MTPRRQLEVSQHKLPLGLLSHTQSVSRQSPSAAGSFAPVSALLPILIARSTGLASKLSQRHSWLDYQTFSFFQAIIPVDTSLLPSQFELVSNIFCRRINGHSLARTSDAWIGLSCGRLLLARCLAFALRWRQPCIWPRNVEKAHQFPSLICLESRHGGVFSPKPRTPSGSLFPGSISIRSNRTPTQTPPPSICIHISSSRYSPSF